MSGAQSISISDDKLREKCAVFGSYGASEEASRMAYYGLWALQHRGQESSGIASSDGKKLYRYTDFGLVAQVYKEEDLIDLPGKIAIGHNRYSTSGGREAIYNQPFVNKEETFALAHNGNFPITDKLENYLAKQKVIAIGLNDTGMMTAAIDCFVKKGATLAEAIKKTFPLLEGVFSAVAMDKNCLVAFRDHCGIRPLSIAKLDKGYVVASETCAFDTIGATFLRDVKPGEMVVIDSKGLHSFQIVEPNQKLDIFEFVYFARPDSVLLGKTVNHVREDLGRNLAREHPIEADMVVPVPDSSSPAALGYSKASGIPFEMGLVKNRYINRTFIRPTAELRERDLKMKLNPIVNCLKGNRVILVDDSIVRGTTMRQTVALLRSVGVKEVHLMISCPEIKYPDFYGINTPDQDDLISSKMNSKQLAKHLGADSLHFLSYEGMVKATGLPEDVFSTSPFTGIYPIPIGRRTQGINYINSRPVTKPVAYSSKGKKTKSIEALV